MALSTGTYGHIAPRSGLAVKCSIDIGAGVIDPEYHGPVKVLMINNSDKIFSVRVEDHVAQLILEKMATPQILEIDNLPSAEQDQRGFSSTGLASPDDGRLATNTMEDLEEIPDVELVIANIFMDDFADETEVWLNSKILEDFEEDSQLWINAKTSHSMEFIAKYEK